MEADLAAYRRTTGVRSDMLEAIDSSDQPVVVGAADYDHTRIVAAHWHGRAQLMHALQGIMLVVTPHGRWMVPHDHALWMPARVVHEVTMIGAVRMRSAYVAEGALAGLPGGIRVFAMSPLLRELLVAAVAMPPRPETDRDRLLLDLILHEIPRLEERPLALPLPADARLAALCERFIAEPTAHVSIDDWAREAGMSRRSLTRHFQQETGLSLSRWRQQASLFAALPRLAAGEAVTAVAMDLGYESVAAFTTMFRRMMGSPPRAYAAKRAG